MDKKIKVLVIGPDLESKGGISTVIKNFRNSFTEEDISLEIFSTWKEGGFFKKQLYVIKQLIIFIYLVSKNKYDIVHIHFAQDGSFYRKSIYARISKFYKARVIMHSHSSSFDLFYNKLNNNSKKSVISFFKNYVNQLVVLSEEWKNFYIQEVNVDTSKIMMLANAVDDVEYSYDINSNIITMFGRLGTRKGTYDLLEVAEKVYSINSSLIFKLYGDGEVEKIKKIITEREIKNVEICGWISGEKKRNAIKSSGLNVLPSYNEGMPMAILETMSFGVPNLSTNIGGIKEVISSNQIGYIVSPGNIDLMVKKIIGFFESEEIRKEMSLSSYERIKHTFSITVYNENCAKIYKEIFNEE